MRHHKHLAGDPIPNEGAKKMSRAAAILMRPVSHGAEAGVIAGEIAGALLGVAAGPPGALTGLVLGAVAGGISGKVMADEGRRARARDAELDDTIGVTKGDLGAARARPKSDDRGIHAPSAASSGAEEPEGFPAEGPMQDVDEDG